MKTQAIALSVLLLALFASGALALPNLVVDRFEYSPSSERIVARIVNDSDEPAENFFVAIFVDGNLYKANSIEEGITLRANSSLSVSADFKMDGRTHYFTVIADAYKQVEESNEEDNVLTTSLEGDDSFTGTGTEVEPEPNLSNLQPDRWNIPIMIAGALLALLAIIFLLFRRNKHA